VSPCCYLGRSAWRENPSNTAIFSRTVRVGFGVNMKLPEKESARNAFTASCVGAGLDGKRRLWTASERGRTARNRQPVAGFLRARAGGSRTGGCRPSGRKVNLPASPYSPCGGSFLPWKDVERATLPIFATIAIFAGITFPAGAIRVNSTGGRPSTAIETQHAESSFAFNHMVNLPRAESAPCGGTAVSSEAGSTAEPGERVLSTAGIAVAAGSNIFCVFPGAGA